MLDTFLFVGLPYVSLAVLVLGSVYRYRYARLGVSSMSSQLLEGRTLGFSSAPWHVGILVVFGGHLVAFLIPAVWNSLTSNRVFLLTVETIGLAAATLCILGLGVLLVRRLTARWLQAVAKGADYIVLSLLLAQVLLGVTVAIGHRWGAAWSAGTTTPYLWSLVTLRPEPAYVAELHPVIQAHLVGAWVVFLVVPFTRLIHIFAVPLQYLIRAPQLVIWTSRRYGEQLAVAPGGDPSSARRSLLQGSLAAAASMVLLGVGAADKLFGFLGKQKLSRQEQTGLMAKRYSRVQLTAEERALELERMRNDYIFVAKLGELQPRQGKYFVDYKMRPAMAFRGEDGLPNLIGAKCTHLGCTVGNEVDDKGKLLCPCHISFFDIKTGQPDAGAPAKQPLPKLGWVLRDDKGEVAARMGPDGRLQGTPDRANLDRYGVYVAKEFEEEKP
jgi:nitrate reductase gamma subunit